MYIVLNPPGKATKNDVPLRDQCLYLKHIFKDQPRLLRESGETGCAIQKSHAHHSIVPSICSTRISTYTEATHTLLTWELHCTKIALRSHVCVCVCSSAIITCAKLRHSVTIPLAIATSAVDATGSLQAQ